MSYAEKITKGTAILSGSVLALLLSAGCAEKSAALGDASNSLSRADLAGAAVTSVKPGESAYVAATDPNGGIGKRLIALSPDMSDHIYPHAITDEKAPTISETPVRFRTEVALHGGGSNYLDNDAACDIYNVAPSATSVGIVALGGAKDGVFVAWPTEQGKAPAQLEVCMFQNSEPRDGVIMFAR